MPPKKAKNAAAAAAVGAAQTPESIWNPVIKKAWWKLNAAPAEIQENKSSVMHAIAQDGMALEFAAPSVQEMHEVVAAAVIRDGEALRFASDELRGDPFIVRAALGLPQRPEDLNTTPTIISVQNALEKREKDKPPVVPKLSALRFASESLRGADTQLLLEAIAQAWWCAEYVLPPAAEDPNFWRAVIGQTSDGWMAFSYAPEILRGDPELLRAALKADYMAMKFAPQSILDDRQFMLEAVGLDWRVIRAVPKELQADREIVRAAALQDIAALEFAICDLSTDKDLLMEAVEVNARALMYVSDFWRQDDHLIMESIRHSGKALAYANDQQRADREFVNEAMKSTIGSCSGLLWRDREVVK